MEETIWRAHFAPLPPCVPIANDPATWSERFERMEPVPDEWGLF
jgi:hypothetical protein